MQGMAKDTEALKILGKNLRARRKQAGLTQERLAELCEVDSTYISLLELGKRNPAFSTIVTVARNLKCKVSDLTIGI